MKRVCLYVPVTDNDGKAKTEVHNEIREILVRDHGGFSQHRIRGFWQNNDGKLYAENVILYEVLVNDNVFTTDPIRRLAEFVKTAMRQESVLFTVESVLGYFI